jgi:RHS repeat-associated protein
MGYVGPDNSLRLSDGTASFKCNALGLGTKTVAGASNYYTRDPGGQLLSDRTTSGTYNYVFDGLGSVAALTSSTGTVAKTYSYDPYGTVTAGTGTVDNPWQYASGFYDSGLNTVKFGQRYYDPSIARWTQTDPIDAIGIQQGNRYLYVGGNPVNATDPSGLRVPSDPGYVGEYADVPCNAYTQRSSAARRRWCAHTIGTRNGFDQNLGRSKNPSPNTGRHEGYW